MMLAITRKVTKQWCFHTKHITTPLHLQQLKRSVFIMSKLFCKDPDQHDKINDFSKNRTQERLKSHRKIGKIGWQQLYQDFQNPRSVIPETVKPNSEQAEAEVNKANAYYEQYYKMFGPAPEKTDTEEINLTQDQYYEQYRNAFAVSDASVEKNAEPTLTHTDEKGQINMVDVGHKQDTSRVAKASGKVLLGKEAFSLVQENKLKKGDVITTAKIAGIMAAKKASNLIPLCHPLAISRINIMTEFLDSEHALLITCEVHTKGKTGVEMEALMGVSVSALTVYDMCKAVTHDITITDVQLLHKSGGISGDFFRAKH